MNTFLTILHVMVCFVIIIAVLLQRGKGAEIGAVFGGGASSTVFGSRGAGNFLTKLTTGSAVIFMATSLALAYFSVGASESESLLGDLPAEAAQEAESAAEESPFAEIDESRPGSEGGEASPFEEVGEPVAPGSE